MCGPTVVFGAKCAVLDIGVLIGAVNELGANWVRVFPVWLIGAEVVHWKVTNTCSFRYNFE